MHRKNLLFWRLLALLALLVAWFLSGWKVCPSPALTAAAAIVATMVAVALAGGRILPGSTINTAAAYLLLATANVNAWAFSSFHAASLLIALSLCFYLIFNTGNSSLPILALSSAALGTACMLEPAMLWLAPVMAVTTVARADDKARFWATFLFSLILPFLIWIGARVIADGWDSFEPLRRWLAAFWLGMTDLRNPSFRMSFPTVCRLVLAVLITSAAMLKTGRKLNSLKIVHFDGYVRLILLTFVFALLTLLFFSDGSRPASLFVMLPAAPLLDVWLGDSRDGKVPVLTLVLLLVLIVERVALFL